MYPAIFRERLVEEKKKAGISAESMAARSRLHISEDTISRILNGKTTDPGTSTLSDICETLNIEMWEIFMDSTLAAEFKVFLELKSKNEETEAERIRIIAENEDLKARNLTLTQKIEKLEMKLEHKEEIIALNDRYLTIIENIRGEE